MIRRHRHCRLRVILAVLCFVLLCGARGVLGAELAGGAAQPFPPSLESYGDAGTGSVIDKLRHRAQAEPFNVIASVIFFLAIMHTFLASKLMHIAHRWRDEHAAIIRAEGRTAEAKPQENAKSDVSFKAEIMHFLGEVEAIFGIWVVPLLLALAFYKGWPVAERYVSHGVNFTEPLFVVIVMAISATRPVLRFAEQCMAVVARLGGSTPAAWWLSILTIGPLLGSFITEPAAMTISALLLARQFFDLRPSNKFKYGTLGLLFVNISVGGTLTHFAAPPVLMVAGKWGWGMGFMFTQFGWKAALGILIANAIYFVYFRGEFARLRPQADAEDYPTQWSDRTDPVPPSITVVHLFFLAWTVFTAHYPAFFIGGFLFFLAFTAATEHHQNPLALKPAILVGFFLGGLVIHGGLQAWWMGPVLASLTEVPLMFGAMTLTAFNDNAAITYLASLVPDLAPGLKYAVVAGAVAGGGLTVIANAPNPAGQSILSCYFKDGVSPLYLVLGALLPTFIVALCFLMFR